MVSLSFITDENFNECIGLKVTEDQRSFVATNVYSLAQAWLYHPNAYPFAIYADDVMVGFVMMGYDTEHDSYDIWRFMIDERYQGKGYGKAALARAIEYLRDVHEVKEIMISYKPDNVVAKTLYASAGFVETGEMYDGEILAKLTL